MELARPYAAIVLAGGRASRLGGADKSTVRLDGRRLLDRVLDAVVTAREVVVVGDPVDLGDRDRPLVRFTRESPPHGGPAAGLLSGLDALGSRSGSVAVLAVDMPMLSAGTLDRLHHALGASDLVDGAVLVDGDGRRQLALVARADRLEAARAQHHQATDLPLWRLLASLDLVDVAPLGAEHRDVDTWGDLVELTDLADRADRADDEE